MKNGIIPGFKDPFNGWFALRDVGHRDSLVIVVKDHSFIRLNRHIGFDPLYTREQVSAGSMVFPHGKPESMVRDACDQGAFRGIKWVQSPIYVGSLREGEWQHFLYGAIDRVPPVLEAREELHVLTGWQNQPCTRLIESAKLPLSSISVINACGNLATTKAA